MSRRGQPSGAARREVPQQCNGENHARTLGIYTKTNPDKAEKSPKKPQRSETNPKTFHRPRGPTLTGGRGIKKIQIIPKSFKLSR